MTDPMIQMQMDDHIRAALREDMPFGDVSTAAVMPEPRPGRVQLIAKADGVIAGLAVFSRVFALLDPATRVTADVADGERVSAGQHVAAVEGDVRVLLEGERTALNYLQRMSGIATYTARIAAALEGTATTLVCTRKTTPGMRLFEREAHARLHAQDHARHAPLRARGRAPGRRQPAPLRPLRRRPAQGQPHRRRGWHHRGRCHGACDGALRG